MVRCRVRSTRLDDLPLVEHSERDSCFAALMTISRDIDFAVYPDANARRSVLLG